MRKLRSQRIIELVTNREKLNFILGSLNDREFDILWEKINEKLKLDPLRKKRSFNRDNLKLPHNRIFD